MTEAQAEKLLELVKDRVPCGCYAIKYEDYIELENKPMTRAEARRFKFKCGLEGITAYVNGI